MIKGELKEKDNVNKNLIDNIDNNALKCYSLYKVNVNTYKNELLGGVKMKKKVKSMIFSIIAASTLLTSLGGGSAIAADNSDITAISGEKYPEGTFLYCSAGLPQYKKIYYDNFLERQGENGEGVNVDYQTMDAATLQQRLIMGFTAGTFDDLPDVVFVGPTEIAEFEKYGLLMDLTDILEPFRDLLVDGALDGLTFNDKIYAFPDEVRPQVLYYNREIFEEYGIDPERCETIEGWIEVGRELKEKSGGEIYLSNYDPGANTWRYYGRRGFIPQANGNIFDEEGNVVFDTDEGVKKGLETLDILMSEELLLAAPWFDTSCFDAIRDNKIATFYIGAFYDEHLQKNVPEEAGKWGILTAPYYEEIGTVGAPVVGGAAIVNKPDNKYAQLYTDIWKDYNFNFEERKVYVQQMMDEGGPYSNTVVLEALEDEFWQQGDEFYGGQSLMKAETDGLVNASAPLRVNENDALADSVISPEIEKYLAGEQSMDEAISNAAEQLRMKIEE